MEEHIIILHTHNFPQETYMRLAPEETAIVLFPENTTGPRVTPLEGVPVGELFCVIFNTTEFQT